LSTCHQVNVGRDWGWAQSVHPACTTCDVPGGNVVIPLLEVAMRRMTTRFGLVTSDEDSTIKQFLGFGQNNCAGWNSPLPPAFPAGKYPMGLADLRTRWMGNPNAAMYVVAGAQHTFLGTDLSQYRTGTGINMLEWVTKVVDGSGGWENVNP
jgi:hypothetical protein